MFGTLSSLAAKVITYVPTTANTNAPAPSAAVANGPPASAWGEDFVDVADEPYVPLRIGTSSEVVLVPYSWGTYVPTLMKSHRAAVIAAQQSYMQSTVAASPVAAASAASQYSHSSEEQQHAVKVSFGSLDAHKSLEVYFDRRTAWPEHKEFLKKNPPRLLQVLEYSAGLGSQDVFLELCKIFAEIFRGVNPMWPSEGATAIKECGRGIRRAFGLPTESGFPKNMKELEMYFVVQHQHVDVTHSCAVSQQRQDGVTQDEDLAELAKHIPDTFRHREWQPDANSRACPKCGRPFAESTLEHVAAYVTDSFVRSSHCRVCGLRVCANCTQFTVEKSIAKLSHPGRPQESEMRKACPDCYRHAKLTQSCSFLGQVFVFSGLNLVQVSMLRTVNQQWSLAAEMILHDVRAALYEMPDPQQQQHASERRTSGGASPPSSDRPSEEVGDATTSESPMLMNLSHSRLTRHDMFAVLYRNSAALLAGHPEHVLRLLTVMDWSCVADVSNARTVLTSTLNCMKRGVHQPVGVQQFSHWHLLCTRWCTTMNLGVFCVKALLIIASLVKHQTTTIDSMVEGLSLALKDTKAIDTETRSALIPLILDLYTSAPEWIRSSALSALHRYAAEDVTYGLQAYYDLASRPEVMRDPHSAGFSCLEDFLQNMISGIHDEMKLHARPGALAQPSRTTKLRATIDFLRAIELVMEEHRNADIAIVRQKLFLRLQRLQSAGNVPAVASATGRGTKEAPPYVDLNPVVIHPFRRGVTLTRIRLDDLRFMSSTVRPLLITLEDAAGVQHRIFWKGEDMRQDYIVCLTGALAQRLLVNKQEIGVASVPQAVSGQTPSALSATYRFDSLVSYRVLPTTTGSGLIQCVSEAESIRSIIQKQQASDGAGANQGAGDGPVLRHLRSLPNQDAVRKTFLLSSRFFILFNYMFKIRDRHRDNVLMTTDGSLFHIDFGMILDEKTMAEAVVTDSYVRFDRDLEECIRHYLKEEVRHRTSASLGGRPSDAVVPSQEDILLEFLAGVASWLNIIRPHAPFVYALLQHLERVKEIKMQNKSSTLSTESLSNFLLSGSASAIARSDVAAKARRVAEEARLKTLLFNTIYMRTHSDATCKREFVERVKNARGKERVKDWTHETGKWTGSYISSLWSSIWSARPQVSQRHEDPAATAPS